jgi:hypothetical protein
MALAGFLIGLPFGPENGDSTFFWDVGELPEDYTAYIQEETLQSHRCENFNFNVLTSCMYDTELMDHECFTIDLLVIW